MGTRLGTELGTILGTVLGTDLGGAGGAPPPVDPNIYYLNGFTSTAYYQTAAPGGEPGNATGFVDVELWAIETQTAIASTFRSVGGRVSTGPLGGYSIFTGGTNTTIQAGVTNGAGGNIIASYTVPAAAVLKWLHVALVRRASSVLLFINGVQAGADLAITGYTAAAVQDMIGRRLAGLPGDNIRWMGKFQGTGTATGAAVLKHYADCVAAADVVTSMDGIVATHSASVKRDQTGSAPATLTDSPGTDNFSRQGSPTFGTDAAPSWFAPSGAVDLIIGTGDSNMEGYALTSVGAPVGYPPTDRSMFMVRNDLVLRELAEPSGQGAGTSGWACGGFFSFHRRTATGRNTIFVNGGWSGLRTDEMLPATAYWTRLIDKIAVATKCPNVVLRGFVDFSGFNNALQGTTGWAADLDVIEAALRADLAGRLGSYCLTVPWLYVRARSTVTGSTTLAQLRSDQAAWESAAPNRIMVQQDDGWAMQGDGVHMTTAGYASCAAALEAAFP